MRFLNRYRKARYTARATRYEFHGNTGKEKIPGLHAQFSEFVFDSDVAQAANRWSDEDRVAVEQCLLSHSDFGHIIHLLDGTPVPADDEEAAIAATQCLFMVTGSDGISICGTKVENEGDYCDKHASMLAGAMQAHPNRPDRDVADVRG